MLGEATTSAAPDETAAAEPWAHRQAVVNGVRLHYVEQGSGPLVVLLHGFPEFWYSWRYQIPALAAAGYHVIAPDMRGYNESEKPRGVASYRVEVLAQDVASLIQSTGESRATVVGHDWGGAVAWSVPMRHPEAVDKLIVINAPHPRALQRELRTVAQLRKSWYVFFFQLPWIPEIAIRRSGFATRAFRRDVINPSAFSDADLQRYKRAIARPGALSSAINYYRAALRGNVRTILQGSSEEVPRIDAPTLLIWGERDRYLGLRLTEGLEQWVPNIRVERIAEASHWAQLDAPDRVNELMLQFLRGA